MKPLLVLSFFVTCVAPLEVLGIENSSEKRIVENVEKSLKYFSGQPVAVLVEDSKQVIEEARALLNKLLNRRNANPDFWLVKYNKTGVSEVLAKASEGEETFSKQLQPTTLATNFLGPPEDSGGSVTFFSILKAARLLPPETAILLFTQHRAEDEDLAQLATKELKRQRIKLFTIWLGGKSGDEKLLREVSSETVGLFFMVRSEKKRSEAYFVDPLGTKAKSIVYLEKRIKGHKLIYFPVDTHVTALHLSLDGVLEAKLRTPRGYSIGVLDSSEVATFSEGSFVTTTNQELGQYEVELRIESTSGVGMWRLDVNGVGDASALRRRDASPGYDVAVFAETDLTASVALVNDTKKQSELGRILRIKLNGKYSSINNVSFLDNSGAFVAEPFTILQQKLHKLEDLAEAETSGSESVDVQIDNVSKVPIYVRVDGTDENGNRFSRLSYYERNSVNYRLPRFTIEVNPGSELLVSPNQPARIFFEVTNNRDQIFRAHFECRDQRRFLISMHPQVAWLRPKQAVVVTVEVIVLNAAEDGLGNVITFAVLDGAERIQKTAVMRVVHNHKNDIDEPRVWQKYTSDCTNVLLGRCEDATWAIEITAQDQDSGLLQLTSNPKGLFFPNSYTAGTTEPVTGFYSGSCCESKLQITAVDLNNNRRTYTADAYYANLSSGSIAAIVLGVLLLIVIIAIIVALCVIKCRKKDSLDLPTFRPSRASTRSRY